MQITLDKSDQASLDKYGYVTKYANGKLVRIWKGD